MRERPILFSAPMVRAILDGRKTQTRRIVKPQPIQPEANCHPTHKAKHAAPYLDAYCGQPRTEASPRGMTDSWCWWQVDDRQCLPTFKCPYGAPGDRLWVREAWGCPSADRPGTPGGRKPQEGDRIVYRANPAHAYQWDRPGHPGLGGFVWRPSIHMPRWASRITLEITDVRVERLNDISEADATAEGTQEPSLVPIVGVAWSERGMYAKLWESINGVGSWATNPWVWIVSFKPSPSTLPQGA